MPATKTVPRFLIAAAFVTGVVLAPMACVSTGPAKPLVYPKARKGDVVDDHHGTKVPDPYRWLEWPKADDPAAEKKRAEIEAWIEAENRVTID